MRKLAMLWSLLAVLVVNVTAAQKQPNVILVMTDDQGYGDVGAHGNTMIRTPNLDKLHGQSVRLTDFHVDPTCSPTRAALLTGRYSTRSGVWHTIMGRSLMYHDEVTLADVFKANNYRTGMFGKWHLGDSYPMRPQDRGFEETLIHGGGGVGQTPDYWGNDYFDDTYWHNGKAKEFKGYCTDVFFNGALNFIEKSKDKPFFVYLPTNVPHGPYNVEEKYAAYYKSKGVPATMANFYGMIEQFDENMGVLMGKLKEWGLEENTIVMFMTDNGTAAGGGRPAAAGKGKKAAETSGWTGFNAGMRAAKGSPYDGGHRVPFFIRWPKGGIGGGKDVTQLAAHMDVLPTLVDLCGLKFTAKNPLDGKSLVPLLKGDAKNWPERTFFVHTQREEIPPKWKSSAVMTSQWRLVNGKELYDIKADKAQATDIAAKHPEVVAKLTAEYEAWWTTLEPSFSRYGWITLGAPQDNPTHLNCMDWHAEQAQIPWHQGMIDRMPMANGYWMVEVAAAGKYEFTLRHKPAVAKFGIQATHAVVKVGEVEAKAEVSAGASEVKVTMNLPKGQAKMQTWLKDETKGTERGAFFVEVRKVD
jgi:arylsulfatase A-like enzyme